MQTRTLVSALWLSRPSFDSFKRVNAAIDADFAAGTPIAHGAGMTTSRLFVFTLLFLGASSGRALAQAGAIDDEPQPQAVQPQTMPPAPTPVPDATLMALRGHILSITQRSGACFVGQIIGFDAASVTLALVPSRSIVTIPRSDIAGLALAEAPPTTTAAPDLTAPPLPPPFVHNRHFGLQLGLAPAVTLDVEAGHFYGFLSADLVLPMADTQLLGFSGGAGVTFALSPRSHWNMDIFAHLDIARFSEYDIGGGVGIGFHYTASNGFTLGFKIPILGYSGTNESNNNSAEGVAFYYLGAVMSLPVISLGYRF